MSSVSAARYLTTCRVAGPMAADAGTDVAAAEQLSMASEDAESEAKLSAKSKRTAKPKIDLDDEIRRANDLAAMSRKMLSAAKNVSRNTKKAKQRLIKKAGKLSPEDLERIAVLKRCGLFEEGVDNDVVNTETDQDSKGGKKGGMAGPSDAEAKRPKLAKTLEQLTASNPILEEIGVASFGKSSTSAASSSWQGNIRAPVKKTGPVVLGPRSRLLRAPSVEQGLGDSHAEQDPHA